jgi:hypothetical protein
VVIAVAAGLGISHYIGSRQSGPPAAAGSPGGPGAAPGVAPGSTSLQNLKQDFGPWKQLAGPATGSPALLLLQSGAAEASGKWTVPGSAAGWSQDLGGNVASATVSGGRAAITDADGVGYTVGVGQPFIVAGNPGTVLLVNRGGTVMSMSLAQATAVRQSLRK